MFPNFLLKGGFSLACNFTCGHALNVNFTSENKLETR